VKYKEGTDYSWINFQNSEITGIQLLTGPDVGVVYHYGKAKIVEEGELAKLQFDYTIVNSGEYDIDELTKDENFVTIMGDVLREILMNRVETDEQIRTNNPEEFNLQ
jgi:hypothetical protein